VAAVHAVTCGEEIEYGQQQWDTGVSSLSDAERDACDVVQALAGLAALLARPVGDVSELEWEDARRTLLRLAEDGNAAAVRVLAYLRGQRGAGDGEAVAVAPRLGPWRDWVPSRGYLFGGYDDRIPRVDEVHHRRRADPGE
jgi:hypothetical protein